MERIGKLTEIQAELLYTYLHAGRLESEELKKDAIANPKKFLPYINPWWDLYEIPFKDLLSLFLIASGMHVPLVERINSEDAIESFFDFTENDLPTLELPEDSKEYMSVLLQLTRAIDGNLRAFARYSTCLNDLLKAAKSGDDESLFQAIYIDRMIASSSIVATRIAQAETFGNEGFFHDLAKAINRSRPRRAEPKYDDARFMINALIENIDLDQLKDEAFYELIAERLQLYPVEGKDPFASFQKLFRKQKNKIKELKK